MGVKPKLFLSIENRVLSNVPILVIHCHASFISFEAIDKFISILNDIFPLMPINVFPLPCLPVSPLAPHALEYGASQALLSIVDLPP